MNVCKTREECHDGGTKDGPGSWCGRGGNHVAFRGIGPGGPGTAGRQPRSRDAGRDPAVGHFPNQVADVAESSQVDGGKVVQWVLTGAANQRWETEASLDGYYRFKSSNSGKCLNVFDASGADGAQVIHNTCGGKPSELWKPLRRIIGYQLINKNSGKCLAVGGGPGQGHPLIQLGCSPNGDPANVWLAVWEPPAI